VLGSISLTRGEYVMGMRILDAQAGLEGVVFATLGTRKITGRKIYSSVGELCFSQTECWRISEFHHEEQMGKGRLEAFSDGVIAIIITIMVLELEVPHGATVDVLWPLMPVLLSYVLSFIYVGIYWNKLQLVKYPSAIGTVS
jgi:hypothetical protein